MNISAPVIYYKINGQSPPPSLRILGLKHYMQSDMIRKVEFHFENHDQRLQRTELKNLIASGNKIQFSYGYINDVSQIYEYEIRGYKGNEVMKVIAYQKIDETTRSINFKKTKYSDVAKIIAQKQGLKTDGIQDTKCAESQFRQNKESDIKFLSKLAKKIHFEFGIDEDNLIFRERQYNGKASHVFVDRGKTITSDVIKFTPALNTFQIPAGYEAVYINNKNANREKTEANTSNVKRNLLGGNAGVAGLASGSDGSQVGTKFKLGKPRKVIKQNKANLQIVSVKGKGLKVQTVKRKQRSRKKKHQKCTTEGLFKAAEDTIFKAKLEVVGQPRLKDKELIEMQRVGVDNEGLWYVYDIINEVFISSAFISKINLERNTVGFAKYTGVGKGSGRVQNNISGSTKKPVSSRVPQKKTLKTKKVTYTRR